MQVTDMELKMLGLTKRFGRLTAVDDVWLELPPGDTLALVGPSGCGKSTLLRMVAGLEEPDAGRLQLGDRDITGVGARDRGFGMVFQDFALFPHLDVAGNVAFGLVEKRWPRHRREARVAELLELVGLAGYGKRRVESLSGGQQQRVALARALAPEPRLLLLDEPLASLDRAMRDELQEELARLLATLDVGALYVTHDQDEAFRLAPQVAVMRRGRIEQLASRSELQRRPRNAWVARFLGHRNVFGPDDTRSVPGVDGSALLRDELVGLDGELTATVRAVRPSGRSLRLELFVPSWDLTLDWHGFPRELPGALLSGDAVGLRVPPEAWVPLQEEG